MDAVDQTLLATEKLLKALEEKLIYVEGARHGVALFKPKLDYLIDNRVYKSKWDKKGHLHYFLACKILALEEEFGARKDRSLLGETSFIDRLADLRTKHKETTEYLGRLWEEESRYHAIPHSTCRQWAVHHCPSERMTDPCPNEYSVKRFPEYTIHHRPSEYTIHHRPSEFTIHHHSPPENLGEHRQNEYPGPTRKSEYSAHPHTGVHSAPSGPNGYSAYHPSGEYVGVYRSRDASTNQHIGEASAHHFRRDISLDLLPTEHSTEQTEYDIHYRLGDSFMDQFQSKSSALPHSTCVYPLHTRQEEFLLDHPSADYSVQHRISESPRDQSLTEALIDWSPSEALVGRRLPDTPVDELPREPMVHHRQLIPSVYGRKNRAGSLPAKPLVQDAAEVLHLTAKAKAKRREERAQAKQEQMSILEKVEEMRDEQDEKFGADRISTKEKGNRANGHSQEEPSGNQQKIIDHTLEQHSRKNSRRRNKSEEKSLKKDGHNESLDNYEGRQQHRVKASRSAKTMPPRSKSAVVISEPSKTKPSISGAKRDVVPDPIQYFVPQVTVPVPFKFSSRKPILNRYSAKFVEEMLTRKKQEQEEEEAQAIKTKPFKAHEVPKSTYVSTNPRVNDKAYVEAIRRRVTATMRKHFEQEALSRRSKSVGDISVRPVPITTYLSPSPLPDYRRGRSTSRRAVQLLVEASTPPVVREHSIRTHVSTKVRHLQCLAGQVDDPYPRPPIPDFQRLHAEMDEALKNAPHKATTIPRPFHLTDPKAFHHRQCKSSSPPLWRARNMRRISKGEVAIRPTHSSKIRAEAIRQHQEKLDEVRHRSEKFWEDKKEEMDLSRLKLRSSMGSLTNVSDEIEKKTAEKIKHSMETTREYEKYLTEMQQRIIDRPLIMERQSIIAQKQRFSRKYEQRLAAIGKGNGEINANGRQDSNLSGGTYSVQSKEHTEVGENSNGRLEEYGSGDFDSEEDSSSNKKRSTNSSASSSSQSSDASSSSESSSSKKSKSSGSSASNKKNETYI